MPAEDVVAGGILRIIHWLAMEIFINSICWGIGWCILRIFTLGSYPKPTTKNTHIIATGLLGLITLMAILIFFVP
jgi:hypothetical protein